MVTMERLALLFLPEAAQTRRWCAHTRTARLASLPVGASTFLVTTKYMLLLHQADTYANSNHGNYTDAQINTYVHLHTGAHANS
jgi:hypothetical protein